jgi:hypothetical protein
MPTAHNPRRLAVLVGLLVVLAGLVATSILRRPTADKTAVSSNVTISRSPANRAQDAVKNAEAVELDALKTSRPNPVEGKRNPFRFGARPTPSFPESTGGGSTGRAASSPAVPVVPTSPSGPAGAPPIPLKFIGFVDAPTQGGKLVALSDGRSVFYGHDGEIIDGRFKIVRIGVESIEMTYLDGRGRQTIRLSGQ